MQASFRLVTALDRLRDPRVELMVVCVTPRVDSRQERVLEGGTRVVFIPQPGGLTDRALFGYPAVARALAFESARFGADLIHAQGTAKYIYAATHFRLPHIVTIHGIYQNEMKVVRSKLGVGGRVARFVKIRLERHYVSCIRELIAITEEVEQFVRSRSRNVRVHRIDNPIDDAFFSVPALQADARPVILFVAAITFRKGLDYLLQAFESVVGKHPDAQLRIAGIWDWDPSYVQSLKDAYRHRIESGHVAFLGGISQEQLVSEMAGAVVLCLPSRAESAPMVISQAMAAARPVVASRVGGIPAMIRDGLSGSLVEVGDVSGLAASLNALLEDGARARSMGEAGRADAQQRYASESVARQTVKAYVDAASGR